MSSLDYIRASYDRAGIAFPYNFQIEAWTHILQGRNALVSAGTGRGKTEAAVLPAIATGKRIILLYPTKALLQDQRSRLAGLASGKEIAIDTGDEDDRHFYRADIILSSLDKFLYRLFGYGKKRWSYLYPYRIGFQSSGGTILALDEAHAYENVAFSHFWFILKKLSYERSIQTILLSATLPQGLVKALEDRERKYFPRPANEESFFQVITDAQAAASTLIYGGDIRPADVASKAIDTFREGRRVIIVLERVLRSGEATEQLNLHEVWEILRRSIADGPRSGSTAPALATIENDRIVGNVLTYHGHQMPGYRARVLERLKELDAGWKPSPDGSPRMGEPFILVTTSAMEVGVDVSSDVMITDVCGPDSFAQRIGRCARRPGESGEVYVVARGETQIPPHGRPLWSFLKDRPSGSALNADAKRMLNDLNVAPDLGGVHLRLEYIQDQSLYRYIYDFIEENRELWEKGVVITRDWEPSVALVLSESCNGQDYIGGILARDFWRGKEIMEKYLLPLSGAADLARYCAWVFEGFNEGNQHVQRVPIGGSKERTLAEALVFAGVRRSAKDDANKIRPPLYGLGLPLILVLPKKLIDRGVGYRDHNLGLEFRRSYVSPQDAKIFPPPPSPVLSVGKVILRKVKPDGNSESAGYELPLYWFEPRNEELTL